MSELQLVKSAMFGEVQADIYQKNDEPYMTINQLAECLGYTDKKGVEQLISRNAYLKSPEFSLMYKVPFKMRGTQNTRIFTEDGIYEITMLAKTEKAKEFRGWIRKLLKSLRRGETTIVPMNDYQRMVAKTREANIEIRKSNANIRAAQNLIKIANKYEGSTYQQVLHSYATELLTGERLVPLPSLPERTYSATDLGTMLGVSAHQIGVLANRNGLKTSEYGAWYNDKAKGHNKEVQTFRYYGSVIPVLQQLIKQAM